MNTPKTTILLAMILGSLASRGQDTIQPRYQSVFGDSNAIWYVSYIDDTYLCGSDVGTETWKALSGDTVNIHDTCYNILRSMRFPMSWGGITMYSNKIFLRESPNHSKLYFRGNTNNSDTGNLPEILVMDLDLNIGDTLDTRGWAKIPLDDSYESDIPVIRIDTIYYQDGRKIQRTNYQNDIWNPETLLFIEGIGPNFGPYYARYERWLSLTCYYKDEEHLYRGTLYNNDLDQYHTGNKCFKSSPAGTIKSPDGSIIATIFPNPTHNNINITLSTPSNYRITITSATGCAVYNEEFYGDRKSIDLQWQPRGVYFATITSSENTKLTKKVIKL